MTTFIECIFFFGAFCATLALGVTCAVGVLTWLAGSGTMSRR